MAEKEELSNGQAPKKRGRPAKTTAQPVVNEAPHSLEMAEKQITIGEVQDNLNTLYKRVLGNSNPQDCWLGNINNLNLYNPFIQNQRLKMLNTLPNQISREDLAKALTAPQNNEEILRSEGWAMSASQYLYYKILRLAADVPMYKWYVTPELLKESDYKSKDFEEEDKFVNNWLKTFDVANSLKRVALEVKREGKQVYVLRNSIYRKENGERVTNFAAFQKLPSNYIKLVKIGQHGYVPSFNMMIFMNPGVSPSLYPEFIQEIWADMVSNGAITVNPMDASQVSRGTRSFNSSKYSIGDCSKLQNYSYVYEDKYTKEELRGTLEVSRKSSKLTYFFWVQLPQDLCYTFCSDSSTPWAVPDTSGLLMSLDELEDYDTLQGLIDSTPLTAVLTAEAETIPNPNPGRDQTILNPETIAAFQDKFNDSTSTNLEALFAPLKNFKLLSLPSQPNGSEISATATKNVINRAGLGGIISTTDKPSVSQVKTSQLIAEAEANFVTLQIESVLNMIINKLLGCKYKWNLHIWGGIFTFAEEQKRDKELFVSGASFLLPKILSGYDMDMRDARAIELYTNALGVYKDLKTITQERKEKADAKSQTQTTQGRPEVDVDESENDNTLKSKDSGLDTADMRV